MAGKRTVLEVDPGALGDYYDWLKDAASGDALVYWQGDLQYDRQVVIPETDILRTAERQRIAMLNVVADRVFKDAKAGELSLTQFRVGESVYEYRATRRRQSYPGQTHVRKSRMTISSSLEDRIKALGWLAHGGELAVALRAIAPNTATSSGPLLQEAVEAIDKTPDQERRWLTSGNRSGGWNMIGMTRADLIEIERNPIALGNEALRRSDQVCPADETTSNAALGVLDWLRWCNSARLPDRLTKAAVALARGGDQRTCTSDLLSDAQAEPPKRRRNPHQDHRVHPDRPEERPGHRAG